MIRNYAACLVLVKIDRGPAGLIHRGGCGISLRDGVCHLLLEGVRRKTGGQFRLHHAGRLVWK